MTPAIPPQRRSGVAQRHDLARGLERMAHEAEAQDPGHSWLAPFFVHLARLAAGPPGRTSHDYARLAAAFYNEPFPPEPVTDEYVVKEAR